MENWDDIRVFLAVARAESLSGAAPGLKMDPATLGRRVARLEERLGTALFVKSPQGYALTPRGELLMDRGAILMVFPPGIGKKFVALGRT
ncbi:LysR family transcriptional regulator, partial [Limimaricola sp. ASW11-118]